MTYGKVDENNHARIVRVRCMIAVVSNASKRRGDKKKCPTSNSRHTNEGACTVGARHTYPEKQHPAQVDSFASGQRYFHQNI